MTGPARRERISDGCRHAAICVSLAIMSTEMVSLLVTAGVSVVGLLTNTFISMNSTRAAQRLAILTSQQSREDRLRDERREIYTRFLGAIDAWNRAVYPALLAAKEYAATGTAERLADMDPDAPTFPSAARPLIKAFQDLDQAAVGVRLAASSPVAEAAEGIRAHVQASTFVVLDAATDTSPYVPNDMLIACTQQMGQHLGYASSSPDQG